MRAKHFRGSVPCGMGRRAGREVAMLVAGVCGVACGLALGTVFRVGVLGLAHGVAALAEAGLLMTGGLTAGMAATTFVLFSFGCQAGYMAAAAATAAMRQRVILRGRLRTR